MNKKLLKNFCAVFLAGFMALLLLPQSAQAQEKEAYVVKSSDQKTLTFYYDDQKSSRTGTVWGIEETKEVYERTYPAWSGTYSAPESEVTTAVFDASFKNYLPQSTKFWFSNLKKLKKIEGLTNLNTSKVTTMMGMFDDCKSLTSLDLSNFRTENVQDMIYMFYGCQNLTSLDLSNFNTEIVYDMSYMFYGCQNLTSLNLSNFNTEKVRDMSGMFYECNSLQTIYCNNTWTYSPSWKMFYGCTSLQGAVPYDASKMDASMANPNTGYFTKKGSTGVTTTTLDGNANIQAIYSTDGRRLNELQRGLNIVRMNNGTTQKILRK